jgi:hypothetical protein
MAKSVQIFDGADWHSLIGPEGPSTPSADPNNALRTGSDSLLHLDLTGLRSLPDGRIVQFDPTALAFAFDTTYDGTGDTTVTLPLRNGTAALNAVVDWGDGSPQETVTDDSPTHTYAADGLYVVHIRGTVSRISTAGPMLVGCLSWGDTGLTSLAEAFSGSSFMNMHVPAPPLTVTNMDGMFRNCRSFNQPLFFNTSAVTSVSGIFSGCSSFNQPVAFDLSNATSVFGMFESCTSMTVRQVISAPVAVNADRMFSNCSAMRVWPALNLPAAESVRFMFETCLALSGETSYSFPSAIDMTAMFIGCRSLDQCPYIDAPAATEVSSLFRECVSLSAVLSNENGLTRLNLPSSEDWGLAFENCIALEYADFSECGSPVQMIQAFRNCRSLKTFSGLDTSRLLSINGCFSGCPELTSSDIEIGPTTTHFEGIYAGCGKFNQRLTGWTIGPNAVTPTSLGGNFSLPTDAYNDTLTDWNNRRLAPVRFKTPYAISFGNSKSSGAGTTAKQSLIAFGWTITDGGTV